MMSKRQWAIKLAATLFFLTGVTVVIGFGCGSEFESVSSSSIGPTILNDDGDDDGLTIISGAKTTSIVYAGQVLKNMESLTGIKANNAAMAYWREKKGVFSEFGVASSVTAPMMMVISGLSAEFCLQLVNDERGKAAASRRYFSVVDFSRGPASFSNAEKGDVIRRMARNFWSTNETEEELNMLLQGVAAANFGTGTAETAKINLFLCTSMLSSLDAIQL